VVEALLSLTLVAFARADCNSAIVHFFEVSKALLKSFRTLLAVIAMHAVAAMLPATKAVVVAAAANVAHVANVEVATVPATKTVVPIVVVIKEPVATAITAGAAYAHVVTTTAITAAAFTTFLQQYPKLKLILFIIHFKLRNRFINT
jgi:hypothetical protein